MTRKIIYMFNTDPAVCSWLNPRMQFPWIQRAAALTKYKSLYYYHWSYGIYLDGSGLPSAIFCSGIQSKTVQCRLSQHLSVFWLLRVFRFFFPWIPWPWKPGHVLVSLVSFVLQIEFTCCFPKTRQGLSSSCMREVSPTHTHCIRIYRLPIRRYQPWWPLITG